MNRPTRSFFMLAAAACVLSAAIGFYSGKRMRSPESAINALSEPSGKVSAEKLESPAKPVRVPGEAVASAEPASAAEIILTRWRRSPRLSATPQMVKERAEFLHSVSGQFGRSQPSDT